MSVQNPPYRNGLLCVSVTVTATATKLTTLVEQTLGLAIGRLAGSFREVNIEVDPEVSSSATVRIGNSNLGQTVDGVVQKGLSLVGSSFLSRATVDAVYFQLMYAQTVTGTAVLNLMLSDM